MEKESLLFCMFVWLNSHFVRDEGPNPPKGGIPGSDDTVFSFLFFRNPVWWDWERTEGRIREAAAPVRYAVRAG